MSQFGRPNTAFRAQADRIQFDSRVVIPTFINGVSCDSVVIQEPCQLIIRWYHVINLSMEGQ